MTIGYFRPARITEVRFWANEPMRSDHRFKGLLAEARSQRGISAQHLAGELAEIAVSKRADNGDVDRVIRSYRREHNLTSEQIRSERRARPFTGRHRSDLAGQ